MAVDIFGDEDAWQWYIARIMGLIAAPHSILHDELLGSAGYPSADEWEAIDREPRRFRKLHSDSSLRPTATSFKHSSTASPSCAS